MIYAAERAAAVCATLAKLKTTTGTIDAAAAGGMPDRQNSFTLDGHSYPLTSNSTAIDLKAALAAKRGRSVGDCYVVYGGNPMNDEAAVEAPTGGEVTQAIFRVKVDGKTELIPASDESTVDELKAAVAAKIGRAVGGAFYFAVAGKPLTGSTIRKLRAQGKKIELCYRLRGGGTIVQKVNAIAEQLELAKGPPAVVVQQANEMMGITPPAGATVMSQVEELMVQLNLAEAPKPTEVPPPPLHTRAHPHTLHVPACRGRLPAAPASRSVPDKNAHLSPAARRARPCPPASCSSASWSPTAGCPASARRRASCTL